MSAHPRPLRRFSPIAKALVVAGSAAIITATGAMTGGADAFASPPPSPTSAVQIDTQGGAPLPPTVPAWTWAVVDADTGDLVAGRDWHWPLPSASTLKTLTAYTLINRLQLDSTYRAMPSDANAEGSHVGLIAGSHYSVRDLMHGMLMPSGNDAAMALAHAYGGVGPTTEAMNAEAARLGAQNTHAVNSSGLDEPGQTTSAYDLALIMRASLKNPDLRQIYSLHDTMFPAPEPTEPGQQRNSIKIWTENRLILNYYPGALAGKTGFTSQAGRTFVSAVERDGHTLIVAIMRCAQSSSNTAIRLYDWAFQNLDKLKPIDHLVDPQPETNVPLAVAAAAYDDAGNLAGTSPADAQPTSEGVPLSRLLLLAGFVGAGMYWVRRRRGHADRALQEDVPPQRPPADVDLRGRTDSRI